VSQVHGQRWLSRPLQAPGRHRRHRQLIDQADAGTAWLGTTPCPWPVLQRRLRRQILRDNGFRKTQRFLRFFQPLFHSFAASLEPGIPGPENTKTRSQGPGFEYRLPFGGLSKKRVRVVGRGRFELPQLSRRFYRPCSLEAAAAFDGQPNLYRIGAVIQWSYQVTSANWMFLSSDFGRGPGI
jgi:hypothetical protein